MKKTRLTSGSRRLSIVTRAQARVVARTLLFALLTVQDVAAFLWCHPRAVTALLTG
jgi:hypothetical protein